MSAKKWLSGCLIVIVVLLLGLAAAWWFVLRPMWNAGSEWVGEAKAWTQTLDLGEGVVNKEPFTAPDDGRLTPEQVQALVQVQQVFVQEMGADLGQLAERVRQAQALRQGGEASFQDMAAAYSEMTRLLKRAREAQLKGVNQAGLSREEYHFIRSQALAAMPLLVDVGSIPGLPSLPGADAQADPSAAQANAELLRPHLPLLSKSLGAGLLQP
ncbi:hypothetical protein [Arenimonas sp. MALMAid1274]|uniref:hypothetical protein n=1 Tax=Arenimonas sp. MALMAid1274 TaxID=3411630 RepID=UPI003BA02C02